MTNQTYVLRLSIIPADIYRLTYRYSIQIVSIHAPIEIVILHKKELNNRSTKTEFSFMLDSIFKYRQSSVSESLNDINILA